MMASRESSPTGSAASHDPAPMARDPETSAPLWRDLALLALLASLLFLPGLGARDLWAPNEPNYGEAVTEMSRQGVFLVPILDGVEFPEKPILYYWMGLISVWALGGVNELALRLPLALCGIASVLLCYLLVLPYAGRSRARMAALLLATTYSVYWTSRSVQMDLLVMLFTLGAILSVTRVLDHGFPSDGGWMLAGVASGLGFLSKGPIGVIIPSLVVFLYLLATRRVHVIKPRAVLCGLVALVAVASPWYVALYLTGRGEFLHEVLWRQNVTRFLEAWDHVQPWWYYLVYFWVGMAPWAVFVPLAAALPDRSPGRVLLDRLGWAWIAGVVGFFSLSESKRGPYLVPVAPAVAILASALLERLRSGGLSSRRQGATLGLLLILTLLLVGAGLYAMTIVPGIYPPLAHQARAFGLLAAGAGVAMLLGLPPRLGFLRFVPVALGASVVALYLLASMWVLPAVDQYKSARGFMGAIRQMVPPDGSLATYKAWHRRGEYCFYGERLIPRLDSPEQVRSYWEEPGEKFLIVQEERLDEIRPVLGDTAPVIRRMLGSETDFVFGGGDARTEDGQGTEAAYH